MATGAPKRVAVLGIDLESNAWAPPFARRDFEELFYGVGDAIRPALAFTTYFGFSPRMDELCAWEPVPILLAIGGAGGPCDHAFYEEMKREMRAGLAAAGPLDGVYIHGHGAGITTELDDLDGDYFGMVRDTVGPDVPVVALLDLHGNVSEAMVAAADVLVAYRTNPHVDIGERSAECAALMHEMFEGMRPAAAFRRLPLVAPSVTQLTAAGHPYGDLIAHGQDRVDKRIANVSILTGFAYSDTTYNGMAILVTARGDRAAAEALADELAERAWGDRERYVPRLIGLDDAVRRAVDAGATPGAGPLILADVADNPGGGGRGNTTYLLRALHEARAAGIQLGVFYDPALAAEAHERGADAEFTARFNRDEASEFSEPFEAPARVVRLTDGAIPVTRGMLRGGIIRLGPTCVLDLGGIAVVVVSIRQQITSADYFTAAGLDPAAAATLVLKSRGHFRAGFDHLVRDERIFEVDVPGLTSPNLIRFPWKRLPRPVYPMDPDTPWPA